jgi:hypothetical protein
MTYSTDPDADRSIATARDGDYTLPMQRVGAGVATKEELTESARILAELQAHGRVRKPRAKATEALARESVGFHAALVRIEMERTGKLRTRKDTVTYMYDLLRIDHEFNDPDRSWTYRAIEDALDAVWRDPVEHARAYKVAAEFEALGISVWCPTVAKG